MILCANFMNLEAIKETVRKYEETWGAPGEPYTEVSLEQMVANCSMCDFGIEKISQISETVMAAAGDMTAKLQQDVRHLTGEPLKRKCYKPVEK